MIVDGVKNVFLHRGKTGVVSFIFLVTIEERLSDILMNGITRRQLTLGNTSIILTYEVQHPLPGRSRTLAKRIESYDCIPESSC